MSLFLFDPVQGRWLGGDRIHGFHPWLLKLDPAGVRYPSHPEHLICHSAHLIYHPVFLFCHSERSEGSALMRESVVPYE